MSQFGLSRREWLRASLLAGAAVVTGLDSSWCHPLSPPQARDPFPGGKRLGEVDFVGEISLPMDVVIGAELDGRLYTDLSTLTREHPIPPAKDFYIRTRVSHLLKSFRPWTIRLEGLTGEAAILNAERLRAMERPMGVHVMECAGNTREFHFGLMSAASWTGVPISEILSRIPLRSRAQRVRVSGFDRYQNPSVSSIPGASWIFEGDELRDRGAFLGTRMNGEPLAGDHGYPARLIVPGWYGCACIKWVNEIAFVADDAPATSQMQEYAERTGQRGVPALAKDYLPAAMQYAATPIRVERWRVAGALQYRVVGLLWGGATPVRELEIRFNPEEEYVPVDWLEPPRGGSWRFWTQVWTPRKAGLHLIQLCVGNPGGATDRLEAGYYVRAVEIGEKG